MPKYVDIIDFIRVYRSNKSGAFRIQIHLKARDNYSLICDLPFKPDEDGSVGLPFVERAFRRMAEAVKDYRADLKAITEIRIAERLGAPIPPLPQIKENHLPSEIDIFLDSLMEAPKGFDAEGFIVRAHFLFDGVSDFVTYYPDSKVKRREDRYDLFEIELLDVANKTNLMIAHCPSIRLIPPVEIK